MKLNTYFITYLDRWSDRYAVVTVHDTGVGMESLTGSESRQGLANGQLCSDISINLHGKPSRWAVLQQGNPESKRKAVD